VFFRIYESANMAQSSLHNENFYLYFDQNEGKIIVDKAVSHLKNGDRSGAEESGLLVKGMEEDDYGRDLESYEAIFNDFVTFIKKDFPELKIEAKSKEEFWDKIDEKSQKWQDFSDLWPLENKEIEIDEKDEEDISSGLVYYMDNPNWRLKSPDEIMNTHEENNICLFDIDNDMEINFKRAEDDFNPEEFSIYRVSITPLTESSVIKQISKIKVLYLEKDDENIMFENQNDIVFTRTDVDIFDNQQVDSNQIFIVSSPYTIYLWLGQKVENWVLKGAISILRLFSYKIRKIPLTFYPSYLDEEQNLGKPNQRIIFKRHEPPRFQSLFK